MKPSRLQRAWNAWLDLPQGLRPGLLIGAGALAVLAILAIWPVSAHAEDAMIARNRGGDSVRLTHGKCAVAQHPAFPGGVPDTFEAASAIVNGAPFVACWTLRPDGMVLLIFADGDVGLVPAMSFKPDGV